MPNGVSAPGNSPTVPGLTGPVPVPSSGWTSAAGSVTAEAGGGSAAAGVNTGWAMVTSMATNAQTTTAVGNVIGDRPGGRRRIIPRTVAVGSGARASPGPACPAQASAVLSHPAGKLGVMATWATGEVLGLDFETTGVDRFNDVPVSYALVSVVDGVLVRSWSGLIDPGREIPPDATAVHGISTARARAEGMPLRVAVSLVSDVVVSAGRRGVPLVGNAARLRPHDARDAGRVAVRPRHHRARLARSRPRCRRHRSPLRPGARREAYVGRPLRGTTASRSIVHTTRRRTPSPRSRCSWRSRCATKPCREERPRPAPRGPDRLAPELDQ